MLFLSFGLIPYLLNKGGGRSSFATAVDRVGRNLSALIPIATIRVLSLYSQPNLSYHKKIMFAGPGM